MDTDGITFKEQQILCLHEGNVVHTLTSCKFYTLSSYYDKFEYGTVEIKDGLAFLKKLSGEIVIINDAPDYLKPVRWPMWMRITISAALKMTGKLRRLTP